MKEKKYKNLGNNLLIRGDVYFGRIKKSNGKYAQRKLGEYASVRDAREALNNYNEEEVSESSQSFICSPKYRETFKRLR